MADNNLGQLVISEVLPKEKPTFNNTYLAAPVEATFEAKKTISGQKFEDRDTQFSFAATDDKTGLTIATGTNDLSGNVIFTPAKYTTAGIHDATIRETTVDGNGITASTAAFHVKVSVSDDGSGQLKVDNIKYKDDIKPTFANTYAAKPAEVVIEALNAKSTVGWPLQGGKFEFGILDNSGKIVSVAFADSKGNLKFNPIVISEPTGASYKIVELTPSGNGWVSDDTEYPLSVTVTDNGLGSLLYSYSYAYGSPSFVNTYEAAPQKLSLKAQKVTDGWTLDDKKFEFGLYNKDGLLVSTAKNSVDGSVVFPEINYSKTGTNEYTIAEITPSGNGWITDANSYNASVVVTDDGGGQLMAKALYEGKEDPPKFNNIYQAATAIGQVSGEKSLIGWNFPEKSFKFGLFDENGKLYSEADSLNGIFKFAGIPYNATGSHKFTVKEISQPGQGWVIDQTSFPVTINITDDGQGHLISETDYDGKKLAFANTYTALPVKQALSASKLGVKTEDGKNVKLNSGQFSFGVFDKDTGALAGSAANDANGAVAFPEIEYKAPGVYSYIVKETSVGINGWTVDTNDYPAIVTVTDNSLGQLESIVTYPNGAPSFTNVYSVTAANMNFIANKTITGSKEDLKADQFSFAVYNEKGDLVSQAANDANGDIVFPDEVFTKTGLYKYTVKETSPSQNGWTSSTSVFPIEIRVTDDGLGALHAERLGANPLFENTYKASTVKAGLNAVKLATGDNILPESKFTFAVFEKDGPQVRTASNKAGGVVAFDPFEYDKEGVYYYEIRETSSFDGLTPESQGWKSDPSVYEAKVTVTDNGDGTHSAKIEYPKGAPEFTNEYKALPAMQALSANKSALGKELVAGQFSFTVEENGKIVATAKNAAGGAVSFSPFTFNEPGVHTYTIKEEPKGGDGWETDNSEAIAVITVTDNKLGNLVTSLNYQGGSPKFTNVYTAANADIKLSYPNAKSAPMSTQPKGKFSFSVVDANDNNITIASGTNDEDGTIDFSTISLNSPGVYNYIIMENGTDGNGWVFDKKKFRMNATVTDNGLGQLVYTLSYPDGIPAFTNQYTAKPASNIVINAQKESSPPGLIRDGQFTFALLNEKGETVSSKTNTLTGQVSFDPLSFSAAGDYNYTVKEVTQSGSGWTADTREFPVKVKVTDDLNGSLQAEIEYTNGQAAFVNAYNTTPASIKYSIAKAKFYEGDGLKKSFPFTLISADGFTKLTGTSDSTGEISFNDPLTFTRPGSYHYTLSEAAKDGNGWTTDARSYEVVINVTDDGKGALHARTDSTYKRPEFVNTYKAAPAEIKISAAKTTSGKTIEPGQFSFSAYDTNNNKIASAKNDGSGIVSFDPITISQAGPFIVTVKEDQSDLSEKGWDLDTSSTTYTAIVRDNGEGRLIVDSLTSKTTSQASFTNTYTAKAVTIPVKGTKKINAQEGTAGGVMQEGLFAYAAYDKNGNVVGTATNDKDGNIEFKNITFSSPLDEEEIYTIKELESPSGWTTDKSKYDVSFEVSDNGAGSLVGTATVLGKNPNIVFTNSYSANPATQQLKAKKITKGKILKAGQFEFDIYSGKGSNIQNKIRTVANDENGDIDFDKFNFPAVGDYYFTAKEVSKSQDGWQADDKEYTYKVTVSDDAKGNLVSSLSFPDGAPMFYNTYSISPETVYVKAFKQANAPLESGQFGFNIVSENSSLIAYGTNDKDGLVAFNGIKIDEPGTYKYKVEEAAKDGLGWVIDKDKKDLTITAVDNGKGGLDINVNPISPIVFDNSYSANPAQASIMVNKTALGRLIEAGQFEFEARLRGDSPGALDKVLTGSNDASGKANIGPFTFNEPGTYTYDLAETTPSGNGWQNSKERPTLTITVEDNKKGQLVATVNYGSSLPSFENTYTAQPVSISFSGVKKITGWQRQDSPPSFKFTALNVAGAEEATGVADSSGNIAFSPIQFTKPAVYSFTIEEAGENGDGWVIDKTKFPATVSVTDKGIGQLEAEIIYKDGIPSFENKYTAKQAKAELTALKKASGANIKPGFKFKLTDSQGSQIGVVENDKDGLIKLPALTFGKPGKYSYTLEESSADGGGWTVSKTPLSLDIDVTDDGKGSLVAKPTWSQDPPAFLNTYQAAPANVSGIAATKASVGKALKDGQFEFEFLDNKGHKAVAINKANGSVDFPSILYSEPGVYNAVIRETSKAGSGWKVSSSEFRATVTVTDDNNGQLQYKVEYLDGLPTFENTYSAIPATVNVTGKKTTDGWPLSPNQFSFAILDSSGNEVAKASNDKDGIIKFPQLTFAAGAVYNYTVVETSKPGGGWSVDTKTIPLKVTAIDNDKGEIIAQVEWLNGEPNFINTYKPLPAKADFKAEKKAIGGSMKEGDFIFTIKDKNGKVISSASNAKDGSVAFPQLSFDKEGTYEYTFAESPTVPKGWASDQSSYEARITVTDNGQGQLKAAVDWRNGTPSFINTYTPEPVSLKFSAYKASIGSQSAAPPFEFGLFDSSGRLVKTAQSVNGVAEFTGIDYQQMGAYGYTIKEMGDAANGWSPDQKTYAAEALIQDGGNGKLIATARYPQGLPIFTNTYSALGGQASLEASKTAIGAQAPEGAFEFGAFDANGNLLAIAKNGPGGQIAFDPIAIMKAGVSNFTVRELTQTGGHWQTDMSAFKAVITAVDSRQGSPLSVTVAYPDGKPQFTNTYLPVAIDEKVYAYKSALGYSGATPNFAVGLFDASGKLVKTAQTSGGIADFGVLSAYQEPGQYRLTAKELAESGGGWSIDQRAYPVDLTVSRDSTGALHYSVAYPSGKPQYQNRYTLQSAYAKLEAVKFAKGGPLPEGKFAFGAYDKNGSLISVASNGPGGKVVFPQITVTEAGANEYTIKEISPAVDGWAYDPTEYKASVEAKDNAKGELTVKTSYLNGMPVFSNDRSSGPIEADGLIKAAKIATGADLPDKKFAFGLYDKSGSLISVASNDASGIASFSGLGLKGIGAYAYTIKEITQTGGMWRASRAIYPVNVDVKDTGNGALEAFASYPNGFPTFENVYEDTGITEKINAYKTTSGWVQGDKPFEFELLDIAGRVVAQGISKAGAASFDPSAFAPLGIQSYAIREKPLGEAGWSYDTKTYPVTVDTKLDNKGGRISEITYPNGHPVFMNTYSPLPASSQLKAKKSANAAFAKGQFAFVAYDENNNPVMSAANDEYGNITFPIATYKEAGVHTYTIREASSGGDGWAPDQKPYREVVTVTDSNGVLTTQITYPDGSPNFVNTYTADPVKVRLTANKSTLGGSLSEGQFRFALLDGNKQAVSQAANDKTGLVTFPEAVFSKPGTYDFYIRESSQPGQGWNTDQTEYQTSVTVRDNGLGKLEATISYPNGQPSFKNTYQPKPAKTTLSAYKILKGWDGDEPKFDFALFDEYGKMVSQASNKDGVISFPELESKNPGLYNYVIRETSPSQGNWSADGKSFPVTLEVKDNGSGIMSAVAQYPQGQPVFTNEYTQPSSKEATAQVSARKGVNGATLENGMFDFGLYNKSGNLIASSTNDASGNASFPSLAFTEEGQYIYSAREITPSGGMWASSDKAFPVEITVAKGQGGTLTANVSYPNGIPDFQNDYKDTGEAEKIFAVKSTEGWDGGDVGFTFSLVGQTGEKAATAKSSGGIAIFPEIKYSEPGVYAYQIKEDSPLGKGWSSDGQEYTVIATVTENSQGGLTSHLTFPDGRPHFKNTYQAKASSVQIQAQKAAKGAPLKAGASVFGLYSESGALLSIATNDSFGKVAFPQIDYVKTGQSNYTVREISAGGTGWQPDGSSYPVSVIAKDDGKGQIQAQAAYPSGIPVFGNVYAPENASIMLSASKQAIGAPLPTGKFAFGAYNDKGSLVAIGTNGPLGDIAFPAIEGQGIGDYAFTVKELSPSGGHWQASPLEFKAIAHTIDSGSGQLETTIEYPGGFPAFVNTYLDEAKPEQIAAFKQLNGWDGPEVPFTFDLIDSGGRTVDKAVSQNGVAKFTNIQTPPIGGSVEYRIVESGSQGGGWSKDQSAYRAIVTSEADSTGKAAAIISYPDGIPMFMNKYEAKPASFTISGMKTAQGPKALPKGLATFVAFDSNGYPIATGTNDENGKISFSSIAYDKPGQYTYTVKETTPSQGGWSSDPSQFTVKVNVTDNKNGSLIAAATYPQTIKFTNKFEYTPATVSTTAKKEGLGNRVKGLPEGMFTFSLIDTANGKVVATGTNGPDGDISFPSFAFSLPNASGSPYRYKVVENALQGDPKGWETDQTEYPIEFNVTEGSLGALEASASYPNGSPVFVNNYTATLKEPIGATLEVVNHSLVSGMFTFGLFSGPGTRAGDGSLIAVSKNDANGNISFSLPITKEGHYTYYLRQIIQNKKGWVEDPSVYRIEFDAVDVDGEGDLETQNVMIYDSDNNQVEQPSFTDIYYPKPAHLSICAQMCLSSGNPPEGKFKYAMFSSTGQLVGEATNDACGDIMFDALLTTEGDQAFEIRQIATPRAYDLDQCPLTVEVSVANNDEEASLSVTSVNYPNGKHVFENYEMNKKRD